MKRLYPIILIFFFAACIKEKKQQQGENLIVQAMVNGQWKVTNFTKGSNDLTSNFSPYKFQFKSNNTVDAINSGNIEETGTWNADVNAQTITSNFANAVDPLALLNGTWLITNTTWTSVQAEQTTGAELSTLRLDKQ